MILSTFVQVYMFGPDSVFYNLQQSRMGISIRTLCVWTAVCYYFMISDCSLVQLSISPHRLYEDSSNLEILCLTLDDSGDVELWKNGKVIVRNSHVVDPGLQNATRVHNNLVSSRSRLYLQLRFSTASRYDTGTYQCSFNYTVPGEANDTVDYSEPIFINVRYYPEPICSPPMVIQKGNEATVSCDLQYDETNAPVDVQWTPTAPEVNLTLVSREELAELNGSITSELTLHTTDSDINGELICVVSNEFVSKRCSTSIRTIWPSISVYPTEIFANVGDDAIFTCALQFPVTFESSWEWDSTPLLKDHSHFENSSSSGSIFTISELRAQDNGTIISCFARLGDRWTQADAKLFVGNNTDLTTPLISGGTAADNSSTGWKAGFSVVFIVMLLAIGAIVYLIWRIRPENLHDLFPQLQHKDKSEPKTVHGVKVATQEEAAVRSEPYMDLQNPRHSKTGNTGYTAGETYMDLQPPEDPLEPGQFQENLGVDTDEVYANEITGEPQADEIYDYAEENEEEQVYTNQTVIGPRSIKR